MYEHGVMLFGNPVSKISGPLCADLIRVGGIIARDHQLVSNNHSQMAGLCWFMALFYPHYTFIFTIPEGLKPPTIVLTTLHVTFN